MTIRHNCKQSGCYIEHEMPDWGFLDGAFPRKIVPTDMDGVVEINNNFLMLEWKKPGNELTFGQRLAFTRLTNDDRYTVVVMWGRPGRNKTELEEVQVIKNGNIKTKQKCDNANFYSRCQSWATMVSAPSNKPSLMQHDK